MSYVFSAFLPTIDLPAANDAREYLLEGALFDQQPRITMHDAPDGSFDRMELEYAPDRHSMVLRRSSPDDAGPVRAEASELAKRCDRTDIAATIEASKLVLEWEVERAELDEDAWFALHLWQAWVLSRTRGWLYAPGEGLFDPELQRQCTDL